MKRCYRCKETKPLPDFCINRSRPDGLNHICRLCANAKRSQYGHYSWRRRDHELRKRYGMTTEDYDNMLRLQGGGCAICSRINTPGKSVLSVDHCHETGKVRGLLCDDCNRAIGQLRHSPDLLRRAIAYLSD